VVELASYHETGHALMAALFKDMFDLRKVTINENKNGMGGYTLFTPKERFLKYATKKFMLANLIIALGGRAAEVFLYRRKQQNVTDTEHIFEDFHDLEITTGASNDLMQASKIARDYITRFGFGDSINSIDENSNDMPFIGRDISSGGSKISERTKKDVDKQVASLVNFAYQKALQLISENEVEFLETITLLKLKRTIDGQEVHNILVGPR
jgi:cell division protease FtsH